MGVGRVARPAPGKLEQSGNPAGVVVSPNRLEWSVVMGTNQQRPALGLAAGQLEDEVDACINAAGEVMLFQIAQGRKLFTHITAHRHQPHGIPAGMARNGDSFQVGQASGR